MWSHRLDAIEGIEGWIDADRARAWALEAIRRSDAARSTSSLADYKRERRASLEATTNAVAALNLPALQTPARELALRWPFGVDALDRYAGDEVTNRARAAARDQYPGDALQRFADTHALGDYPQTAPNGVQWVLRVGPSIDASDSRNVPTVMPSSSDVLAYLRTAPAGRWETAAREIAADPWAHYVARRKAIAAENARTAPLWGLTTPEQIAGFQVASDELNRTLGAEWELSQREAARREADRMLDRVSQYASASVIGAPVGAVFQALKLLTGVLPWVTIESPPPALARARTGGVSDRPSDRPTHEVPPAPSAPLEVVTVGRADYVGPSVAPSVSVDAARGLLGASPPVQTPVGPSGVQRLETGGATPSNTGSASSSSVDSDTMLLGGGVALALLWLWLKGK